MIILKLFRVLFSQRLRRQAALDEELPNDDNVVAKHVLCHLHPVNCDVECEVLPSLDSVIVDGCVVGDDEGIITTFTAFLPRLFGPSEVFVVFFFEGLGHFLC